MYEFFSLLLFLGTYSISKQDSKFDCVHDFDENWKHNVTIQGASMTTTIFDCNSLQICGLLSGMSTSALMIFFCSSLLFEGIDNFYSQLTSD